MKTFIHKQTATNVILTTDGSLFVQPQISDGTYFYGKYELFPKMENIYLKDRYITTTFLNDINSKFGSKFELSHFSTI